jgi:hypothetical protein
MVIGEQATTLHETGTGEFRALSLLCVTECAVVDCGLLLSQLFSGMTGLLCSTRDYYCSPAQKESKAISLTYRIHVLGGS